MKELEKTKKISHNDKDCLDEPQSMEKKKKRKKKKNQSCEGKPIDAIEAMEDYQILSIDCSIYQ